MVCEKCKKEVPEEARICPYCGEIFIHKDTEVKIQGTNKGVGNKQNVEVNCIYCNKQIKLNDTFCEHCGMQNVVNPEIRTKKEKHYMRLIFIGYIPFILLVLICIFFFENGIGFFSNGSYGWDAVYIVLGSSIMSFAPVYIGCFYMIIFNSNKLDKLKSLNQEDTNKEEKKVNE